MKIVVELQYIEGCPRLAALRGNLVEALRGLQEGVRFIETRVTDAETAARAGFRGSPTLLIDGVDAEGMPPPPQGSLSCRVYPNGLPTVEAIRTRIVRACAEASHRGFTWTPGTEKHWLVLVMALTFLSRLPFLWTGYGADHDAGLVARSALLLWNTGVYHESRLPGYPLHEIVSAPLIGLGGPLLSNAATLVVTLIAVVVWSKIIQNRAHHYKLLVLALAFAPSVWQHSAETIDYMWSLLFILAALYELLQHRVVLAGVALGLAAGFRPSAIVAIVPLLLLLMLQREKRSEVLRFVVCSVLVTTAAFTPLLMKYGIPGWFVATREEMSDVVFHSWTLRLISFGYRTVYFVGPLTAGAIAYIAWRGRHTMVSLIRTPNAVFIVSMVGVLVFLGLFLWLPLERAYLLPALPFLLLVVDQISTRQWFLVFTTLLILSGVVSIDLIDADGRRAFRPNLHRGMVIEEFVNRQRVSS